MQTREAPHETRAYIGLRSYLEVYGGNVLRSFVLSARTISRASHAPSSNHSIKWHKNQHIGGFLRFLTQKIGANWNGVRILLTKGRQ
jgi:hypothetical protein